MTVTRRAALGQAAGLLPLAAWARAAAAAPVVPDGRPDEEIARDEGFWRAVGAEFPNDRALLHLNHAAIGSTPRAVVEAVRAYDDIRKFESLGPGTIRLAPRTAIPPAIEFNQRIGVARKAARLRYLTQRWMDRLERVPGVRVLTSRDARLAGGFGAFVPPGLPPQPLVDALMRRHRIHVRVRGVQGEFSGVRVSPNVFTSVDDIDWFCDATERVLRGA